MSSQALKLLGDYMLKGWIMTDESCPVEGCNVPIMLSRDRTQRICVVHDLQSNSGDSNQATSSTEVQASLQEAIPSRASSQSRDGSIASQEDRLEEPRSATPPTPLSNGPASPTFVLPEPSQETLRRRAQSDLASQRIGRKMLQGYAMLGEECLNPECIGVPLVRPPRRDGVKDPRMECVICGNVYVEARDSRGFTTLQLESSPIASGSTVSRSAAEASVPGGASDGARPTVVTATSSKEHAATLGPAKANNQLSKGKGKAIGTNSETEKPGANETTTVTSSNVSSLQDVLGSIDRSLAALSSRLDTLSKCDPSVLHASSFGDVAQQMNVLLDTRQRVRREIAESSQ